CQAETRRDRFTPGLRRSAVICHGIRFGSRLETSVACRRTIRKATSEWPGKLSWRQRRFPDKRFYYLRGGSRHKTQRGNTRIVWTSLLLSVVNQFTGTT